MDKISSNILTLGAHIVSIITVSGDFFVTEYLVTTDAVTSMSRSHASRGFVTTLSFIREK